MLLSLPRRLLIAVLSSAPSCLANSTYGGQVQPTATVVSRFYTIPDCASTCVQKFILAEYPNNTCSRGFDLNCLCRTNTKSGYTLGEAALRCSLSMCSMEVALKSTAYSICDSVVGALPRTHSTITATVVPASPTETTPTETTPTEATPTETTSTETTSTETTSTKRTSGQTTITQTETLGSTSDIPRGSSDSRAERTSTTGPIETSSHTSASSDSTTEHASTTFATFHSPLSITRTEQRSSTTSDPPASESTSSNDSNLDGGAVIGVSVASGVSGFFILGLIIFFCCRKARRRNQQSKDRDFFEIGGAMSEPPDFALPPKRPTPGPTPSSRTANQQPESSRLMSPFEPRTRTPAVVVTGPDNEYHDEPTRGVSPSKIGFAFSSNSDFDASPSQSSQRTVSDLLPDKPVYDLYPKPLRWSQQKQLRPTSGETLFEEDSARPRSGFESPSPYGPPSYLPNRYDASRQYNRIPMAGLPDNPRAMMHGFPGMYSGSSTPRSSDTRRKPVYSIVGPRAQPPRRASTYDSPSYEPQPAQTERRQDDYVDDYWRSPSIGLARSAGSPSPRERARPSFHESESSIRLLDSSDSEFDSINIIEKPGSRRASRHSGSLRPLTPVREVRTPSGDPPRREYFDSENAPVKYPRAPLSRAASPGQEIVSRPRIVRGDDIKRVQIRRGKPQPTEPGNPYSPEDYWVEQSHGSSPEINPQKLAGNARYPRDMEPREHFPRERSLTPSTRGTDLVLHVD